MSESILSPAPAGTLREEVERGAAPSLLVLGPPSRLLAEDVRAQLPSALAPLWSGLVARLDPGDGGASTTTWLSTDPPTRVGVGALPTRASRHDAPGRPDAVARLAGELAAGEAGPGILLATGAGDEALAAAAAVARAFPVYSQRTRREDLPARVRVALLPADGAPPPDATLEALWSGVSEAMRWQDTPADALHTDAFVEEARRLAAEVGARCEVIRGEELAARGLGGLAAVGRAATRPPALVVLSHEPPEARRSAAWVGKGIVYDTGGLAIKSLGEMAGMKGDMGGAAAVLGAFGAAVRLGARDRLHALLCVAENAVGPAAVRPDDVLTLYSGRSVEIVNPDTEGRVVLGDGVAFAAKELRPDAIVDLATLTDGQVVATGRHHAAIVCNDEALEARAVAAGRATGDLVHPLPFCPELFRPQLASEVADLRNAPRDRGVADASCAAQFVAEHLGDWEGAWLHVDLEGPSRGRAGRGTGFGVALLLRLCGSL